jgi:hypothetical protein
LSNRFEQFMKAAQQTTPQPELPEPESPPDVQTSKQPDISTSKAKSSSGDYKRTTVYLSQALHKRLKRASLDEEMEMSDIAEAAIAAWLDERSDV